MIKASGETPTVIEYLKSPPGRERLTELISMMAITPRELLRRKGTPFEELNLDDQLIDAMMAPDPDQSSNCGDRKRCAVMPAFRAGT